MHTGLYPVRGMMVGDHNLIIFGVHENSMRIRQSSFRPLNETHRCLVPLRVGSIHRNLVEVLNGEEQLIVNLAVQKYSIPSVIHS